MTAKFNVNGYVVNMEGTDASNQWLVDESELETYEEDLTGLDNSYFTATELSALDECDFSYLLKKEKFNTPEDDVLDRILDFYEEKAEGDVYYLSEYYRKFVESFYKDITDDMLVRMAGSWMLEPEYSSLFLNDNMILGCLEALEKAIGQVKDIRDIENIQFYIIVDGADKATLKLLVKHFGKWNVIVKLEDMVDCERWVGMEETRDINKVIGRIKRFKES